MTQKTQDDGIERTRFANKCPINEPTPRREGILLRQKTKPDPQTQKEKIKVPKVITRQTRDNQSFN